MGGDNLRPDAEVKLPGDPKPVKPKNRVRMILPSLTMAKPGDFFEQVVRRPVATWMIAIAAAVFGYVSYERLPLNLMPDLSYPTITVRTEVNGYAPEEVESQISRRIEEALATTPGLVELESRSRAGMSDVVLEFAWGTDMNKSAQAVREQLQTTFFPDDATRPLILRFDPNLDPVMRIALGFSAKDGGTGNLQNLRLAAEQQIKRRLEAMDGVASVRVRGGLEREIQVQVREDWLAARGVTLDQVTALSEARMSIYPVAPSSRATMNTLCAPSANWSAWMTFPKSRFDAAMVHRYP